MSRWVPEPDRRAAPRPTTSPEAEIYRRLVDPPPQQSRGRRMLKHGVLGLTAVGLLGLFVKNRRNGQSEKN